MKSSGKPDKNILMIQEVARGLGELVGEVVFVGGATTALYIDDPAAPGCTPSDDVDFLVEISSLKNYQKFENELRKRGFKDPVGEENPPVCRKVFGSIIVDVMATEESVLGFSNIWYPEAIKHKIVIQLPNGDPVSIFSLPYFLATKLEAFKSRGGSDPRLSHDLEDIVSVLDGNLDPMSFISPADAPVRSYLAREFKSLLRDRELFHETVEGFLRASGEVLSRRADRVLQIADSIAAL